MFGLDVVLLMAEAVVQKELGWGEKVDLVLDSD